MADLETARRCAEVMLANDRSAEALGIAIDIPEPGRAIAKMTVREDMMNGFSVGHGGLTFALADTAFAFACNAYDQQAFGASAQIEFLRPVMLGDELTAAAAEDYRGRRNAYYTVEVRNQDGKMVALFHGRSVTDGQSVISAICDT